MTRAPWQRTVLITTLTLAALSGCTMRARRPDGPNREAQELVDALSDIAVACTRETARPDSGQVVVTAKLTPVGEAPQIDSEGSSPGTEAVVACVRKHAAKKLKNPATSPAPRARVRVPLPLVTVGVSYAFLQDEVEAGPP